jgi:hypothetical protein
MTAVSHRASRIGVVAIGYGSTRSRSFTTILVLGLIWMLSEIPGAPEPLSRTVWVTSVRLQWRYIGAVQGSFSPGPQAADR